MKILAIETSCDDTAIAVLEVKGKKSKVGPDFTVLSNIISSQVELHKQYGGVYPMLAKREHQKNLVPVLITALKEAQLLKISNSKLLISNKIRNSKFKTLNSVLKREPELYKQLAEFLTKYEKPAIDAIAITIGPGLEPCLWVGINFVKALASFWRIPVIPVNHIESHILINFLNQKPKLPALALVVSGGHTQIIFIKKISRYKLLGETRDDAAGECFDKTARLLGLGYPGGPQIASLAKKGSINLPRPMINSPDYDFSFSGLKTAVLYSQDKGKIPEMCAEIQQAIIDVLIKKTLKAAKDFKVKSIILGGGVTANQELRKQFAEKIKKEIPGIEYFVPNPALSTDNALMAAVTGYFSRSNKKPWQTLKAKANLRI